jgi:protein SCO1
MMRNLAIFLLLIPTLSWGAQQYSARGMVLKVDTHDKSLLVSCDNIPGLMQAMTMPFTVRHAGELAGVTPGAIVTFTLVVNQNSSYAEHIRVQPYQSAEQDPSTAARLKLLERLTAGNSNTVKLLAPGDLVPDFTLIDTAHHSVTLSQFAGKVVALNFIYTSCALPNFCYRISNNFGVLQRRFKEQLGRNLELITITFDPERDQPEVLAKYAQTWKANPATWHFLTGPVPDVRRVTDRFGMAYFPDEGLMNHSLHTAVIDRQRRLVANIEGNRYSAEQLGDLVETVLSDSHPRSLRAQLHK